MPPWPPPVFRLGHRQRNARNAFKFRQQRILKNRIARGGMRIQAALVMPITAGNAGLRLCAGHQPLLRQVPQAQIVGGVFAPILVGTQPGSTALLTTPGQRRATAAASAVTNSLLSE
ncbi:Uncharacterised protein [Serratia plymuthica]|nr:Uncharacterised protein [Serratia plymuthica]